MFDMLFTIVAIVILCLYAWSHVAGPASVTNWLRYYEPGIIEWWKWGKKKKD